MYRRCMLSASKVVLCWYWGRSIVNTSQVRCRMSHTGIDYSLGRSNYNPVTGIHFGVIAQNSINLDCTQDFEMDYGKPTCGQCGNPAIDSADVPEELQEKNWYKGQDYACVECERTFWSDQAFPDEPMGWTYEREGYKLTDCLDSDIFVLDSPFYTFTQYCSPCVPGAGNLNTPVEDGVKTYCLGHDWFDDGKAPYPVYSVKTGELVNAE
jgi:hypothetical protein